MTTQYSDNWICTWTNSPTDYGDLVLECANQTIHLVVQASVGGEAVRVRISNEYGAQPLHIGWGLVAVEVDEFHGQHAPAGRPLFFNGQSNVTVPPGATIVSDPVPLSVPSRSWLHVSLNLPEKTLLHTASHGGGRCYFLPADAPSPRGVRGNVDGDKLLPDPALLPFVTGVEVCTLDNVAGLVAFGDSLTAGGWPEHLSARLFAQQITYVAVMRKAISGNRLLHDPVAGYAMYGPSGRSRFERDVLREAGVRYVVILLGTNDLIHPGTVAPPEQTVTVHELAEALEAMTQAARERGLRVIGGTLPPFEGYIAYTSELEAKRRAFNDWIRYGATFDAVVDFDQALRDPRNPTRLLPAYDLGDHLHPNDKGAEAMAEAVLHVLTSFDS